MGIMGVDADRGTFLKDVESQLMSVASIARFTKEIVASFCEARAALS